MAPSATAGNEMSGLDMLGLWLLGGALFSITFGDSKVCPYHACMVVYFLHDMASINMQDEDVINAIEMGFMTFLCCILFIFW